LFFLEKGSMFSKARTHGNQDRSQLLRLGGAKCIFRVERFFCSLFVYNKFIWVQQNLGGTAPELPCGYEPDGSPIHSQPKSSCKIFHSKICVKVFVLFYVTEFDVNYRE